MFFHNKNLQPANFDNSIFHKIENDSANDGYFHLIFDWMEMIVSI